jgi:hypothetical protein
LLFMSQELMGRGDGHQLAGSLLLKQLAVFIPLLLLMTPAVFRAQTVTDRLAARVSHIDGSTVYLDGGAGAGLKPGMELTIKRPRAFFAQSGSGEFKVNVTIATLSVVSVSNGSAMCDVRSQTYEILRGDPAFLAEPKQVRVPGSAQQVLAGSINAPASERAPVNVTTAVALAELTPIKAPKQQPGANADENPPKSVAERAAESATKPRGQQASSTDTVASRPMNNAAGSTSPSLAEQVAANAATTPSPQATSSEPALSLPERIAENARKAAAKKSAGAVTAASIPPVSAPETKPQVSSTQTASPTEAAKSSSSGQPVPIVSPNAGANVAASPAQPPIATPSKEVAIVNQDPVHPAPVLAAAQPLPTTQAPAKTVMQAPIEASTTQPTLSASIAASAPPPALVEPAAPVGTVQFQASSSTASQPDVNISFNVKYVAEDAIYIEGGKNAGLEEGMTLTVKRVSVNNNAPLDATVVAEVKVVSVSNTSAVCEIQSKNADIQRGDLALLSQADQARLVEMRTLSPQRKYPQVIAFSEGDPLDEEARESIPKPPLPEINRGRGRIGVDYTMIQGSGGVPSTSQVGGVVRVDMTRLGGSYWNLNGYWRGRLSLQQPATQTQSVYDLVNRTYTIGLTYANPGSHWTAGVGRLYLPWATSLDTFDGGYLGRRFGKHVIVGAFGGTAPDPTSFDYNPDRRTAGTFIAFEGGGFDKFRFTSATGVAVSSIGWVADRQFVFAENGIFYKRFLSIYDTVQADSQRLPTGGRVEGLSRSFATLRIQPFSRFSVDVNHNYFRDVPTFDPLLVGTGLLDKYLFQGFSVGSRLELPGRISIYNNFGQSSRSGDAKSSLNQLYGLTLGRLWKTGLRADARYSKFTSSFGEGNYRALSLSRNFSEAVRIEVTAGRQNFVSSLAMPTDYKLLGSTVDWNLGSHYFFESSINLQQSQQQSFEQWLMTVGYRFDTGKRK